VIIRIGIVRVGIGAIIWAVVRIRSRGGRSTRRIAPNISLTSRRLARGGNNAGRASVPKKTSSTSCFGVGRLVARSYKHTNSLDV